ncbi:putative Ig domain protein [compost metagenome]
MFGALMLSGLSSTSFAQSYTESFDDISLLAGNGWLIQNNSTPVGSISWFQGTATTATPTPGPFNSYTGAANSYIGVNFNSTGSTGTISNWLITPNRTLRNGDVFTFYTRKPTIGAGQTDYPDRLEVRLSTNGASTNVGSGAAATGDFSTLLLSVNPTLVTNVYPQVWTQYTITISGLPAPTSGRIAFRYFVTGAGSLGTNSDYIGIDQVVYTPYVCPAFTMTPAGALTGGTAGSAYSSSLTQTGALGAPAYAVTGGAVPPGMTLSASGTISGTPTATGTFNFTVTVSDASGCSGSQSYSITVVCPANPVTFSAAPTLCDNAADYTLIQGSPAGGTYSGTGVTGGAFDPSSGTQTITYDITDPYGCAHSSNYTITVNTAPTVTQSAFASTCDNIATVALTGGSPAGGTYSGTGVTGTDFDPSAGTQTLTYTYTDANNCTSNATATITVNTAPTASQSAIAAVCADAGTVALTGGSPAGGTYSGTGVTGSNFNPASGTQVITYSYTDANGCIDTTTTTITVNPLPTVTFTSPVTTLCENHSPLTLSGGSPTGGTYSGTGVSGGVLNPATAGAGNHAILYSYTDGNGCEDDATFTIVVDDCLGLNENGQDFGLAIYPNPTNGKFTMNTQSGVDFSIVNVVDVQGKEVRYESSKISAQTIEVDFSNQVNGVYFVKGLIDGQHVVLRVQKY